MSGDHPNMEDFEGHVDAVASDLEYFRRLDTSCRIDQIPKDHRPPALSRT